MLLKAMTKNCCYTMISKIKSSGNFYSLSWSRMEIWISTSAARRLYKKH